MKRILAFILLAVILVWSVNIFAAIFISSHNEEADPVQQTETERNERTVRILLDGKPTIMTLTEYLTGVLISEMPAEFHIEAKKAQAIAARTFVLRMEKYSDRHGECAVCDDPGCCQGFLSNEEYISYGGNEQGIALARDAVIQTSGMVLTYRNELIEATYFSCSGGRTEDAVAVWGTEIPYLQSVDSPGEEGAAFYVKSIRFTAKEFQNGLGVRLEGKPNEWFGDITYSDGGGVATINICGKTYSGNEIRKLLQLRSTWFTVLPMDDSVIITTRGFGHRVGMSQYGADAMANMGSTCTEILKHYYQNTEIQKGE